MTPNELQTAVEELETLVNTDNDYAEAERQARLLFAEAGIENVPELHCKVLLVLSKSLWRRGLSQESLPYAEQALSLAQDNHFKDLEARALNMIGIVHQNLSDYLKALEYYGKALALDEELGNKRGVARHLGCIAIVHRNLSDYPKALEYYAKALSIDEELGNKAGVARHLGNIGIVRGNLSDYPTALEYFGKAMSIDEELGNKAGVAANLGNIGVVYVNLSEYPTALEYYGKAISIDEELGNKAGVAIRLGNIGNVHKDLSDYPKALEYYGKALAIFEELGRKDGIAHILNNCGLVYQLLSDYPKALEYFGKALALNEELGNKAGVATNLGNIGEVSRLLSDYPKALECYGKALSIDEELGNKAGVAIHLGNIGNLHRNLSDYPKALEYYGKALALAEELGNKYGIATILGNCGSVYAKEEFEGYDAVKAEEYFLKTLAMNEEIGAREQLYGNHKNLSELYEKQGRWKEHSFHYKKYHELEKEVQSEEAKKKADQFDYERKTAEREKQLAVERAEAATVKRILHNTLPPIIADRLINNETFIADSYPNVSVLFMDLVNFTRIAAIIPPRHLIYLLNTIFSNADAVMEKHGLEKIKTIGDAYMAVAGAPIHQDDHAQRAALAAIDVMEAMNNLSVIIPEELGETSWTEHVGEIQVRIGLHCGEAIGGVIGDKKFSFDLWGDAVNTASRMESHGEAGRIHCSEEFMHSVETHGRASLSNNVQFISRGEMEIKGKGRMKTYFLEKMSVNTVTI